MGAGVDATRVVSRADEIAAQVAGRRHAPAAVGAAADLVHRDVAVGAIRRAESAADAVILDDDLDGAGVVLPCAAVDGIDRAADEAVGIEAGAAGTAALRGSDA